MRIFGYPLTNQITSMQPFERNSSSEQEKYVSLATAVYVHDRTAQW